MSFIEQKWTDFLGFGYEPTLRPGEALDAHLDACAAEQAALWLARFADEPAEYPVTVVAGVMAYHDRGSDMSPGVRYVSAASGRYLPAGWSPDNAHEWVGGRRP